MDQKLYDSYVKILKNELVPALGCTEPIAIAYAAAKAREVLGQMPESIELCCSGNIIKNVKGVKVPNSNGLKGIDVAATLGVVGGCAERELEVLEDVTEADIENTKKLVQQGFCTCTLKEGVENLYIVAKVIAGEHSAEVTIVNRHTLISRIVKDGEILYQIAAHEDSPEYVDKSVLNVKDIGRTPTSSAGTRRRRKPASRCCTLSRATSWIRTMRSCLCRRSRTMRCRRLSSSTI